MLQKGHQGVELDAEAWDRLITWIDLNGPCHGTWNDVFPVPIPGSPDQRRKELFALYGGPPDDPEGDLGPARYDQTPVKPISLTEPRSVELEGWPFGGAARRRTSGDTEVRHLDLDADFGPFANMADRTFATFGFTGKSLTGKFEIESGIDYLVPEGVDHADRRFDDGSCVTAPIGGRRLNAFGLADMHGNVAEWTLSTYMPYPYDPTDGRDDQATAGEKVVRGGSYLDRPERCRAGARYSYPAWQKVHNVGFRIVVSEKSGPVPKAAR